ncbi:hypothetical protein AVEN_216062-1 [Araneus ventricosus]|uniref:Uncharacterized protein n=1 Tax=Araneus ventricosus TaxID=182803 RepID=A0A4Y2RRB2_ARAVE|nr:hypothetical protein AVEN_216062-1 [Araneus ventricosus]
MNWAWWTSPLATPISRFIDLRLLFMETSEESCSWTPFDSIEDLVARISVAAARVSEISGMFESVLQSLHRRCQVRIHDGSSVKSDHASMRRSRAHDSTTVPPRSPDERRRISYMQKYFQTQIEEID